MTAAVSWRVALAMLLTAPRLALAGPAERACAEAAAVAEASVGLPAGLLLAIGNVESGRRDVAGHRSPWPWTVQAEGTGYFLASAGDATAVVGRLRAAGVRSIDVGCFQINLMHHPDAFANINDGFIPISNASTAARFLRTLHEELGNWPAAVAAYHSRTSELGTSYRDLVLAAWRDGATEATSVATLDARWVRLPGTAVVPVRIWGPHGNLLAADHAAQTSLPRVVTPLPP